MANQRKPAEATAALLRDGPPFSVDECRVIAPQSSAAEPRRNVFSRSEICSGGARSFRPEPLDPPFLRDDPITLYRIRNLVDAVTGLAGPNGEDMTRKFIGGMFTSRMAEEEKAWVINNVLKLPRRYAARLVYSHATQDWFDVVTRIDLPTLLIGARASQIPWKSIVWLRDHIPNARLELFEAVDGGKHFMFMENPDKFNRSVADFIG